MLPADLLKVHICATYGDEQILCEVYADRCLDQAATIARLLPRTGHAHISLFVHAYLRPGGIGALEWNITIPPRARRMAPRRRAA
jgi:hypothetical protein